MLLPLVSMSLEHLNAKPTFSFRTIKTPTLTNAMKTKAMILMWEIIIISRGNSSHLQMRILPTSEMSCKIYTLYKLHVTFCLKNLTRVQVFEILLPLNRTAIKALCYKQEGRCFDPSCCQCTFHWHNPSDRTMALGSTQPLTEMSTRSISWG